MKQSLRNRLQAMHSMLLQLTGEGAYERYVQHQRSFHAEEQPLSRKAFFKLETERKWNGIKRCC